AKFTSELSVLFPSWLMDPVFSVRDAFAASFNRLSRELGQRWSEINIMPELQALVEHKNYLYRIS
ncbi:pppA, partial [Symbiodinium sp. KB8]